METYATTGPKGSNPPKPQVGVADYFAILGVGEELIWKHAQKKQILGIDNNVADGGAKPEEDDAKLLERFYREIVDCTIWAADESSTDATEHPTTMAYKNSANNQPSHPATLPSSPIPSDVTSTVGTDIEKAQMEGWTIVQQTRPIPTAPVLPGENVPPLWSKGQIFEANLDPFGGVNAEILHLQREQQRYRDGRKKSSTPLKDLRDKVQSSFQQRLVSYGLKYKKKYYVSFRRRAPDEPDRPAVANVDLFFVRLHKASLEESHLPPRGDAASVVTTGSASIAGASTMSQGAAALFRVAEAGKQTFQSRVLGSAPSFSNPISAQNSMDYGETVSLDSKLKLPSGFDEWSIPSIYQNLRFPNHPPPSETPLRTILFPQKDHDMDASSSGVEAVEGSTKDPLSTAKWKEQLQPKLISRDNWKGSMVEEEEEEYIFVPILAMRRQRCGEEERFHEDPALVELAVSFTDHFGQPVIPYEEVDPFEEEDEDAANKLLEKTAWALAESKVSASNSNRHPSNWNGSGPSNLGKLCLIARHNAPSGFCDAAFATSVLDRFPYKNYKGLPLPEEELPMFCYPTGCRLHRAKFCDAPLPQYYGFVVKNERGDSIYVSCVSFMEPLSRQKREQLIKLSEKRCRVGLPHGRFLENRMRKRHNKEGSGTPSTTGDDDPYHENFVEESNILMMGFEEMTTFENKTICLVSRYPYWSAFRRFLSHLQSVSGSATDLPLERYISHLLLSVPVPQPGGPSVLVPLPTLNLPMMMAAPPRKDLPLLDLPFNRLFSCLDVPTVVTVVLGFLALERKVIVMSSRPSLVLDVCELLRSLLFPFDLCAPYVPRLTEPFMSCLEFPGAIFAGIHDDGTTTGLATVVREDMPEDSTIVDLDSGSIDCNGDRMDVLNTSWGIIPPGPRAVLVSEIETLCRDAGIAPGQEPLDGLIDPAFEATMPATPVRDSVQLSTEKRDPLDDRAIRDSFLRFFCSVLGGYERFLVVPDVDFLISGNEWFDSKGFLSSVSEEKATFVGALVATQLFQSFIQRRTEASDVHCLLFDECVAEFHSSSMPYGRLGGDVESAPSTTGGPPQLLYSLLVDQSATESTADIGYSRSFDGGSRQGSDAETNASLGKTFFSQSQAMDGGSKYTHCVKNATGDLVSMPTRDELPVGSRFIYCVDGNPTFPDRLNPNVYLPRQPESWLVEMSTASTPMLTRSEKEIEEADRRRKMATTYRGLQTQRRCLWQLPKLMGSHVLGAWLVCIPALVSQPYLSHEQQSKYLLRALGALRLLRSKQRIVPDEAAYRALIVACGRTMSDRRMELVRLFGLLRSDGIFPSAVTLGQYTKALAEGYSKQSSLGPVEDEGAAADVNEASKEPAVGRGLRNAMDPESRLNALDGNLTDLEDSGRKWRQKSVTEKLLDTTVDDLNTSVLESKGGRTKKKSSKPWLPVSFSSSFVPPRPGDAASSQSGLKKKNIRLLALWSRTKSCDSCGYIPLEEEVQAGWDVLGGENDIPGAINCPKCGTLLIPRLGYKEMTVDEALDSEEAMKPLEPKNAGEFSNLPPQMQPFVSEIEGASYVTYISPATLRLSLERHIEEQGEEILDRETLRKRDPEVFFNLWWFCARFSLPLPLPVHSEELRMHMCALVGWDYQISLRGCKSTAKVLDTLLEREHADSSQTASGLPNAEKETAESLGDYPLLSRFNLQGYYASVWDHADLSEILVTLVGACDRRDFRPVVECMMKVNQRRREAELGGTTTASSEVGSTSSSTQIASLPVSSSASTTTTIPSMELEYYRTALYLAKYQCTTAFHAFFPATLKPCKGYHFWCPVAPVPIFDRLLHEAVKRVRSRPTTTTIVNFHEVSDVALGFRSVFGHLL